MSKKGARRDGGNAGRARAADSAMAARMKAEGVKRGTARCPICNKIVSLEHLKNPQTCRGN